MRDILNELLNDLKIAYEKSDIYKYCRKNSYEWFYSLLITSMEKGGPLVGSTGVQQKMKYTNLSYPSKKQTLETKILVACLEFFHIVRSILVTTFFQP